MQRHTTTAAPQTGGSQADDAGKEGPPTPNTSDDGWIDSAFSSRHSIAPIPKCRLPEKEMPAHVAYQFIKDIRQLDANPRLNLASFVTTWMEPEADKLIAEASNVNFVDMEQYASCTDIHNRCLNIIANLYHAPMPEVDDPDPGRLLATGTATIGSSEAIMLCCLALKKSWEARRKAEGKLHDKPNLVMGYNVQVVWEKFCRYWDVEPRFVPLDMTSLVMPAAGGMKLVDENTIGVCAILGSTYNGEYENVEAIDEAVEKLKAERGLYIPIHVDAASGGFVAPFLQPDLKWDFRCKNVVSINVSGHKYGLVYPGLGWAIWRSKQELPEAMWFHTAYLGSDQPNVTLNFSKGAATIVAQYYQFLRLGFQGYHKIMSNLMLVAKRLEISIRATGKFTILSNDTDLPLVAFSLKRPSQPDASCARGGPLYDEFDVSDKLRVRGWVVPAYSMAPNIQHIKLLRAVIREDMSRAMVDELAHDIRRAVEWLDIHHTEVDNEVRH
ncbi:hypothetical protein WJX72_000614 [[Myrmecia] bisecta]|uniref:Glutamate decarboxylase n=1 Tax=[Myrmecia] bisecta TaxID=41462 RepID=A0AAW1PVV8_9CHLO